MQNKNIPRYLFKKLRLLNNMQITYGLPLKKKILYMTGVSQGSFSIFISWLKIFMLDGTAWYCLVPTYYTPF
jgi:hypothetical protein